MSLEEAEWHDLADKLVELVDEASALMVWALDFAKKHDISLDDAFGFHIHRMMSILHEIGEPPKFCIHKAPATDVSHSKELPCEQCYPTKSTTRIHPTKKYRYLT